MNQIKQCCQIIFIPGEEFISEYDTDLRINGDFWGFTFIMTNEYKIMVKCSPYYGYYS